MRFDRRELGAKIAEMLVRAPMRLDLLALAIAELEYPDLDPSLHVQRLDEIASRVRPEGASIAALIGAINEQLFTQEKLRGNTQDYYDPRNSFLNDVLERRTGVPILLSIIYMEVGRRLDVAIKGIGLPGHFLVRVEGPPPLMVDPFESGRIVDESDCEARLLSIYGKEMPLEPKFLEPVTNKYTVTRILSNLRGIYLNSKLYKKTIGVLDVLLAIHPDSEDDSQLRTTLYQKLASLN